MHFLIALTMGQYTDEPRGTEVMALPCPSLSCVCVRLWWLRGCPRIAFMTVVQSQHRDVPVMPWLVSPSKLMMPLGS